MKYNPNASRQKYTAQNSNMVKGFLVPPVRCPVERKKMRSTKKTMRSLTATFVMLLMGAAAMGSVPGATAAAECNETVEKETAWIWIKWCIDDPVILDETVARPVIDPVFEEVCPLGPASCVQVPKDIPNWIDFTPEVIFVQEDHPTHLEYEIYPDRIREGI